MKKSYFRRCGYDVYMKERISEAGFDMKRENVLSVMGYGHMWRVMKHSHQEIKIFLWRIY